MLQDMIKENVFLKLILKIYLILISCIKRRISQITYLRYPLKLKFFQY